MAAEHSPPNPPKRSVGLLRFQLLLACILVVGLVSLSLIAVLGDYDLKINWGDAALDLRQPSTTEIVSDGPH